MMMCQVHGMMCSGNCGNYYNQLQQMANQQWYNNLLSAMQQQSFSQLVTKKPNKRLLLLRK